MTSVPMGERFRNTDYERLFQAAFLAIQDLSTRADNKKFHTVLIWETDRDPFFDPERERKKFEVPTGRRVGLCYWLVNSKEKSRVLAEWFGGRNVVRPPQIEDVRDYALELLQP